LNDKSFTLLRCNLIPVTTLPCTWTSWLGCCCMVRYDCVPELGLFPKATRGFEHIIYRASATERPSKCYFIRCLHNLRNVLVQIANKIGLQGKKMNWVSVEWQFVHCAHISSFRGCYIHKCFQGQIILHGMKEASYFCWWNVNRLVLCWDSTTFMCSSTINHSAVMLSKY
jgi:hypothetical protein